MTDTASGPSEDQGPQGLYFSTPADTAAPPLLFADVKFYKTWAWALAIAGLPWILMLLFGPFWFLFIPIGLFLATMKVTGYFVDRSKIELNYSWRDRPLDEDEEPPWQV